MFWLLAPIIGVLAWKVIEAFDSESVPEVLIAGQAGAGKTTYFNKLGGQQRSEAQSITPENKVIKIKLGKEDEKLAKICFSDIPGGESQQPAYWSEQITKADITLLFVNAQTLFSEGLTEELRFIANSISEMKLENNKKFIVTLTHTDLVKDIKHRDMVQRPETLQFVSLLGHQPSEIIAINTLDMKDINSLNKAIGKFI